MGTTVDKLQKLLQSKQNLVNVVNEKVGTNYTIDSKLSDVINSVNDISGGGGITPTGTINITSNGIVDVTQYASANVNVQGLPQANDMLQTRVNTTKSCAYLFYKYSGNNLDFIANLDTSQATNGQSMFEGNSNIKTIPSSVDTSKFTTLKYFVYGCSNIEILPKLNTDSCLDFNGAFTSLNKIKYIDISKFTSANTSKSSTTFSSCNKIIAIIIRSFGANYVLNTNTFNYCNHILGTTHAQYNPNGDKDGYIYVPRDMISILSNETNWSTHASQLRALEDYTVDGTTTGALDLVKMGVEV